MRIIAGKFRGRNLKSPPSLKVRPTSDRLRETLFNVITPQIEGARFLDLCAGSGAVGIEALSRGAAHVTFVEQSRQMCALIKSNLELCRIDKMDGHVVQAEARAYLQRLRSRARASAAPSGKPATPWDPWDIVFFDPPYADEYVSILEVFGAHAESLASENGLLIVEHHHKKDLLEQVGELSRYRILKQGDSALSFYKVNEVAP